MGCFFLCKGSANIFKWITTPSSRVSPHLLSQRGTRRDWRLCRSNALFRHFVPYGTRTLRIVLSLCHLSLGGFWVDHQRLAHFCLVRRDWQLRRNNALFRSLRHSLPRRRRGSRNAFTQSKCLYKNAFLKWVLFQYPTKTCLWHNSWCTA